MNIDPINTAEGPGLHCRACGARSLLDQLVSLTDAMRPFVDAHRHCDLPTWRGIPSPRREIRLDPADAGDLPPVRTV